MQPPQPGANGKVPLDNSSNQQVADSAAAPVSQPGVYVSPFAAPGAGASAFRQSIDQADAQPQQQAANGPVHSLAWQEPSAQQQQQAAALQGPPMPQAGAEPVLRAKSPFAQAASQRWSMDTAGGDKQYRCCCTVAMHARTGGCQPVCEAKQSARGALLKDLQPRMIRALCRTLCQCPQWLQGLHTAYIVLCTLLSQHKVTTAALEALGWREGAC